jgi:hypothetical protein
VRWYHERTFQSTFVPSPPRLTHRITSGLNKSHGLPLQTSWGIGCPRRESVGSSLYNVKAGISTSLARESVMVATACVAWTWTRLCNESPFSRSRTVSARPGLCTCLSNSYFNLRLKILTSTASMRSCQTKFPCNSCLYSPTSSRACQLASNTNMKSRKLPTRPLLTRGSMPETFDVVWYAAGGRQEDNIQA